MVQTSGTAGNAREEGTGATEQGVLADGLAAEAPRVRVWVDPVCPWAWLTSRWLLEAAQVRGLSVEWHVMSLAILNEQTADAETLRKMRGPVRVLTAAIEEHGRQVALPLYTALGGRVHRGGRIDLDAVIAEALDEVGLPAHLASAAGASTWDGVLARDHDAAVQLAGSGLGTPVVAIGDAGFFGPVLTPAPTGEAAGRVWDGLLALATTPGFYELKRTRTERPAVR